LLRRLLWVEGLVDPDCLGQPRRLGWLADEPLGVGGVGGVQHRASREGDLLGAAVVDVGRGEQADPRVAMLDVVPAEEALAEGAGVLERAEPVREGRVVLEGLELAFGVGVVVGDVRAGVALGDPRSASSMATGLEVMEVPRSAWTVSCPGWTCWAAMVSASSRSASAAASRAATIHPTT
jgi:hypothetical protein